MPSNYLLILLQWDLALDSSLPKERDAAVLFCPTLSLFHLYTLLKHISFQSFSFQVRTEAEVQPSERREGLWQDL